MPRPNEQRTLKSYQREIENLNRLRASLLINRELPEKEVNETVGHIDKLTTSLRKIMLL